MRIHHRIISGAVLLLATFSLAACQAIPSAGPVEAGLTDLQQSEQQVLFAPSGPVLDATQEDVARGFASAAASNTDNYAIARQFLTPEYAAKWDPYSEVLIDEGPRQYASSGDTIGVMSLDAIAAVDSRGAQTPVPPGPKTDVRYEFEQVDGQWRISSAPTGIVLDRATFIAAWSVHQVYFIGAGDKLVPETRWFLSRSSTATQIVNELLAGPREQMRDVLRSGFPAETTLTSTSVPILDGSARIDLSSELLAADDHVHDDVMRQLAASLQTVPGVSKFELFADGALIAESPVGRVEESPIGVETLASAVEQDGKFGLLISGKFEPLGELGDAVTGLDPQAVTLSSDIGGASVQSSSGLYWVTATDTLKLEDRFHRVEPSLDPFGNVWTYAPDRPNTLVATLPGDRVATLEAPWLVGETPSSLRVSPDGSRIAALITSGDSSSVVIAGIIRDENLKPIATTDQAPTQLWVEGTALDFDWIDEMRFATLTKVGANGKVTIGWKGSFPADAGVVPNALKLSGGGSKSMLRVLDEHGDLFAPQGSGWQKQESGVDLLAKRG